MSTVPRIVRSKLMRGYHSLASRPILLPSISVALGTVLIGLHAARYGGWINDDAAITFAYARNLADGHGFVLQPGSVPVEGFSNPSWLLLLVIGKFFGLFDSGAIVGIGDYAVFPKVLALLCVVGILVACHYAARGVSRWPSLVTACAGVLLAVNPSFVAWVFSGLENGLYALTVAWLAALLCRAAFRELLLTPAIAAASGGLALLAAFTRPDGIIYLAAYPLTLLAVLVFQRFSPSGFQIGKVSRAAALAALSIAVFAIPYGAYLLWRHAEFGRWAPNTAIAKSQQLPQLTDVFRVGELADYLGWPVVLSSVIALVVAIVVKRSLLFLMLPLFVSFALAVIAYCVLNAESGGEFRFATPVWTLGAVIVAVAVVETFAGARERNRVRSEEQLKDSSKNRPITWRLTVLLVMIGLLVGIPRAVSASNKFAAAPVVPLCEVAEYFGRVFNKYADILEVKEGSLLTSDVGGSALTSRLQIIDAVGLTDFRIAEYTGAGRYAELRDYLFDHVKPTFMHYHEPWGTISGVPFDSRIIRDYEAIGTNHTGKTVDWVRKDTIGDRQQLQNVRDYAKETTLSIVDKRRNSPTSTCGSVLRPGQLP